ncbi:MAG TPA: TonB family protein [Sphingomicrobium sp.]|nr:TonB family protein [Sphingomicrobium sp.]
MLGSALLLLSAQASTVGGGAPPQLVVGPNQWPPALVQELQRAVRPPQGRLPIQRLFTPYDYPAGADGRRASVGVRLLVAPQGSIVGCFITRSSGSAPLDTATCNIIRRRERYTPALDNDGKPTLGMIEEIVDWDSIFRNMRVVRGN